ncbi:CoA transferase subunit A [Alteribacter keqinensis]|uniref:CoA transferase subunit A n=1 Tax=Alteribacter keqinensis TaxID=2483800 RepID=A0A3M7TU98_9BACI|nr:CoA transferase subunit A [Alteribacter keqinensis]RNA69226.1 CoA transferase subunit A [Alteribacter keqinensis]
MDKVMKSINKTMTVEKALSFMEDGMTIMFGGFGGVGNPPSLIEGMLKKGIKNLTLIGNDAGFPDIGVGRLVSQGRVKKLIASHIGSNPVAGKLMTEGALEVEFSPQGTLAERIRAGGVGLGGILTDTGAGNPIVGKGKQSVIIQGKSYFVETALTSDISIVNAKSADKYGNLIYDTSARNTNPLVAMAGRMTFAEADSIVETGDLDPEAIVTPGVFIDGIVQSEGVNWKWAWEEK